MKLSFVALAQQQMDHKRQRREHGEHTARGRHRREHLGHAGPCTSPVHALWVARACMRALATACVFAPSGSPASIGADLVDDLQLAAGDAVVRQGADPRRCFTAVVLASLFGDLGVLESRISRACT